MNNAWYSYTRTCNRPHSLLRRNILYTIYYYIIRHAWPCDCLVLEVWSSCNSSGSDRGLQMVSWWKVICSRPEDGLRCRQGVKPPLNQPTNLTKREIIVNLQSECLQPKLDQIKGDLVKHGLSFFISDSLKGPRRKIACL